MNKNLLIFIGIFMLFFSCKDDKTDEIFEVYPASLSLTELENSSFFEIISNCNWSLSTSDEWLTCSRTSGKGERSIIVKTLENPTANPRTCTVTVTSEGGAAYSVQVTQDAGKPFINITPKNVNVKFAGGEVSIQVRAFSEWTVQIPAGDANWVSLKSKTETQAVLDVAASQSEEVRSSAIIFKLIGSDEQVTFNLTQIEKKELAINRSLFSLAVFPGDYSTPNTDTQTVDLIWTNPEACFGDPGQAGNTRTYVSQTYGHSFPQWFSIDLGGTYELTKMKLFSRGDAGSNSNRFYAGGNLKEFEVWGALDPDFSYNPDNHGGNFGGDWVLLKSYSVNRPSGNKKASGSTRNDNTEEDIAAALAGYELLFDNIEKVRYIRINTKDNWDTNRPFVNISSIALWAYE